MGCLASKDVAQARHNTSVSSKYSSGGQEGDIFFEQPHTAEEAVKLCPARQTLCPHTTAFAGFSPFDNDACERPIPCSTPGKRHVHFGASEEHEIAVVGDDFESEQHSFAVLQRSLSKTAISTVPLQVKAAALKHIGYGHMKKENQDDFHCQAGGVSGRLNSAMYCIFDGHGTYGGRVVKYCVETLPSLLQGQLQAHNQSTSDFSKEAIDAIISNVFKETEHGLQKSGVNTSASGTTASVVFQEGNRVWCAAVGDSRVILVHKGSELGCLSAQPLTLDHRPSRKSERARVEAAGGRIEPKRLTSGRAVGEPRLWLQDVPSPGLLLSRSIGDHVASSIGCTAEPEITFVTMRPFTDTHLVMASDGIWDVLSNEQVCDIISSHPDPQDACEQICMAALEQWEERLASDNISVVVVALGWGQDEPWSSIAVPMLSADDDMDEGNEDG